MNINIVKKSIALAVAGASMSVFLVAAVAAGVDEQSNPADLGASDSGLGGTHDFQWMCQQYLEIMSTSAS